ncbi:hypothetical protein IJ384_04610 [bacterium]|nr:hypothetical protein [bacterium]
MKGKSPKYLEQLAQNLGRAVRTNNGFNVRVGQVVDGNVQTIATKTLKDGRKITQEVWHSLDGGTYAYTTQQKGLRNIFESVVLKGANGEILNSTINGARKFTAQRNVPVGHVNGKYTTIPVSDIITDSCHIRRVGDASNTNYFNSYPSRLDSIKEASMKEAINNFRKFA